MSISAPARYEMPGLATVTIDPRDNTSPLVEIVLSTDYVGDLNDLERENGLPQGVYLRCDSVSCINDPLLAKFMEVLSHWDTDGDGSFDGDALRDAIDNALWMSRDLPDEFERPSEGWYTGTLMRFMPPPPKRHIVFSFGELKERFRWRHYVIAIPAILAVIGIIQLQIHYLPFTQYSVVSGIMAGGEAVGINAFIALGIAFVIWRVLARISPGETKSFSHSEHTIGLLNRAAVSEEQAFREGSENWTFRQRTVSCIVFGAIHMTNLIYPLATIVPLAIGGAIFMVVYLRAYRQTKFRRSAVLAAALVHRVYNRIALIAVAITMIALLGWMALGIFGVAAIMMIGTVVRPSSIRLTWPRSQAALDLE